MLFIINEVMMVPLFLFILILFIWSIITALIEIQVEGKDGWAINLPTTRWKKINGMTMVKRFGQNEWQAAKNPWFINSLLFLGGGGRDVTAYHLLLSILDLFVAHLAAWMVFQNSAWWLVELRVLAFFQLSIAIEDTLWFVFNPHYGLKNYRQEKIGWHKDDWWWFGPKGMIRAFVIGTVLLIISYYF